jgi:hypothetical protein
MVPLEMNEGTTTVLGVGNNKLTNSCIAEDPAKRPFMRSSFEHNIAYGPLCYLFQKNWLIHHFSKLCFLIFCLNIFSESKEITLVPEL